MVLVAATCDRPVADSLPIADRFQVLALADMDTCYRYSAPVVLVEVHQLDSSLVAVELGQAVE